MTNLDEKITKYETAIKELWPEFIPLMIDTAQMESFECKILVHDGVQDGIEFISPESGIPFWMKIGIKDPFKVPYLRFFGKICWYNESVDISSILSWNEYLGTSIFLLPPDNKTLALKYDQALNTGFPERYWFKYILYKFDKDLEYFRELLNK